MEKIEAAAIRTKVGQVWSLFPPHRHHDIMLRMPREMLAGAEQGFETTYGRFVSRVEAYPIAKAAGQLLPIDGRTLLAPGSLYTEDMW